ncbi:hypothetical protein [Sphingobacterium sp. GVS05A]|uniref:hypothetical protein n=1 Tax=Sphingobacterium sp. GVS05A TaxID=2862679 RepID=UPI001CBD1D7C|nr:hypothetical protein [Sphingobacterium sp. GVS05A]
MEKKATYIAPELKALTIELEQGIAAGSNPSSSHRPEHSHEGQEWGQSHNPHSDE